jgi:transposase
MTTLEDVVPADHPLRAIRGMVDKALAEINPALDALYATAGRPSIAPEVLLRAQLAQILYAIPSERRLCEELRYNLLLRWFVGLPLDQAVFHPTSLTKNRDRLLGSEIAQVFFAARTVRTECLDWMLIAGRRHLEKVLAEYVDHYNAKRPHRGLGLRVPDTKERESVVAISTASVRRKDVLGGLIHEYELAA